MTSAQEYSPWTDITNNAYRAVIHCIIPPYHYQKEPLPEQNPFPLCALATRKTVRVKLVCGINANTPFTPQKLYITTSTVAIATHQRLSWQHLWNIGLTSTTYTLHQRSEQLRKHLLTSSRVLVYLDPSKPFILACDASPYGVEAMLSHHFPDATEAH